MTRPARQRFGPRYRSRAWLFARPPAGSSGGGRAGHRRAAAPVPAVAGRRPDGALSRGAGASEPWLAADRAAQFRVVCMLLLGVSAAGTSPRAGAASASVQPTAPGGRPAVCRFLVSQLLAATAPEDPAMAARPLIPGRFSCLFLMVRSDSGRDCRPSAWHQTTVAVVGVDFRPTRGAPARSRAGTSAAGLAGPMTWVAFPPCARPPLSWRRGLRPCSSARSMV